MVSASRTRRSSSARGRFEGTDLDAGRACALAQVTHFAIRADLRFAVGEDGPVAAFDDQMLRGECIPVGIEHAQTTRHSDRRHARCRRTATRNRLQTGSTSRCRHHWRSAPTRGVSAFPSAGDSARADGAAKQSKPVSATVAATAMRRGPRADRPFTDSTPPQSRIHTTGTRARRCRAARPWRA